MTSSCLRTKHPALRLSANFLLTCLLSLGAATASQLRDARQRGPIIEAPNLGWGLHPEHQASHPSRRPTKVSVPEARAPRLHEPAPAPADHGVSSEAAVLTEAADPGHDGEKPQEKPFKPQPLVDEFLIIYWGVVLVLCISAWFVLKMQHVDSKALAEGGSYHDSAGGSAWKWHALQRKTSAQNVEEQKEFTASGAGDAFKACNGAFYWSGQHNGKTKYINDRGAIVFFDEVWKINYHDDVDSCCFASGVQSGWEPPYKKWTEAYEDGEPVDGESVYLEDAKLQSAHLPENMWTLCLVAALGQAKMPGSGKKDEVILRASLVAAICIFMAFIQLSALFLIIHDIDPNSDPVTTVPSSPFGSPMSVNSMKVIMTSLLAVALVSEAGQCKATFQVGLEVYGCRLRSSRWLPLAMTSMQYLVGISVVWAGCCAILSFQSVPDIIYSSMAITCISNVDEFFYGAFEEVTGLNADFHVLKRLVSVDDEDTGDSARKHKNSVRPLPLAYHFFSKLGLFFPMVFAGAVFGRGWYTGHMPSERVTTMTSGALSWVIH